MLELGVLVPTRSRPHNVGPIVEAWHKTGAFGVADLLFVLDRDDAKYDQYVEEFGKYPGPKAVVLPEWKPLVPKLNEVAWEQAARYRNVAFCGDDHVPVTPNWANRLVEEHLTGPTILYGRDGLQDEKLPTWWSMSSRIVRAMGKMVPAKVQHLFCDNAVKELGEEAGVLRYLDDLLIEHRHPFAGKAPADAQYERVNRPEQYARDAAAYQEWQRYGREVDVAVVRALS